MLSLPFAVLASVLNRILPPLVVADPEKEPEIVALVTVLLVAPLMNRIVDVFEVDEAVVFEIVSELPPVLRPSIVTLSAPFKSIKGLPAVMAPEIVRAAPPVGEIPIDV